MGSYKNNKDGTGTVISTNIQVVDAPMEEFLSRGEFNAVTPNDVGAQNKLVAENEVTKAVSTMPTASASLVGTIVQYVGTTSGGYTNGYFYKCVSDGALDPTYSWEEVISGGGGGSSTLANLTDVTLTNLSDNDILKYDNTTHKWVNETPEEGSLVSAVISKDTMPTASADYNRIAILYTGTTTASYTQGHIYLCVENSGVYSWVELTQKGAYVPESQYVVSTVVTSYTLQPNIFYIFIGEVTGTTELDISLASITDYTIVNEFHFWFRSGSTPTEISFPAYVKIPSDFSVEANTQYEISIVNDLMTYQKWAVS